MSRRLRRWLVVALVVAVGLVLLIAAARPPYLPIVHGNDDAEIARLVEWLGVEPGTRVADVGAGEGTFTLALARWVGPSGHVYATEVEDRFVTGIRQAAKEAGLGNVTAIKGAALRTNLPEGCCGAIFTRNVYHHLSNHAAINADLFRMLRPGGRLLMIDFEPGGIMNWFGVGHTDAADRGHGTRKTTMVQEVTAAGFRQARGPEGWRGRMYAVMFTRP